MPSVIVFSKDRPMQLHAYLESLFMYSDANPSQVSVLYHETKSAPYDRVRSEFSEVNWVPETSFYSDLMALLDRADSYVIFGCDDVVFTGAFCLETMEAELERNEAVFGFSLRLGTNILPRPEDQSSNENFFLWGWNDTDCKHYNYPWELDCTLYRKSDVLDMISGRSEEFHNPNYLEGNIADALEMFVKRPSMICHNDASKAIVITVNRVQDTHVNHFDAALPTDVNNLSRLYNEEMNRMDIRKISSKENDEVHVGADFFILENSRAMPKHIKSKRLRRFMNLFSR